MLVSSLFPRTHVSATSGLKVASQAALIGCRAHDGVGHLVGDLPAGLDARGCMNALIRLPRSTCPCSRSRSPSTAVGVPSDKKFSWTEALL